MKKLFVAGLLLIRGLSMFPFVLAGVPYNTINRIDLVIDLGGGLTTDAQLTFPAVGDGRARDHLTSCFRWQEIVGEHGH